MRLSRPFYKRNQYEIIPQNSQVSDLRDKQKRDKHLPCATRVVVVEMINLPRVRGADKDRDAVGLGPDVLDEPVGDQGEEASHHRQHQQG